MVLGVGTKRCFLSFCAFAPAQLHHAASQSHRHCCKLHLLPLLQILCMHGGLSPELKSLEQIKRIPRPTDVPDTGLLCDLLWADPDKDVQASLGQSGHEGPSMLACAGIELWLAPALRANCCAGWLAYTAGMGRERPGCQLHLWA